MVTTFRTCVFLFKFWLFSCLSGLHVYVRMCMHRFPIHLTLFSEGSVPQYISQPVYRLDTHAPWNMSPCSMEYEAIHEMPQWLNWQENWSNLWHVLHVVLMQDWCVSVCVCVCILSLQSLCVPQNFLNAVMKHIDSLERGRRKWVTACLPSVLPESSCVSNSTLRVSRSTHPVINSDVSLVPRPSEVISAGAERPSFPPLH